MLKDAFIDSCVRGPGEYRDELDPVLPFVVMAQGFIPRDRNSFQEAQVKVSLFQVYRNLMELVARSGGWDV